MSSATAQYQYVEHPVLAEQPPDTDTDTAPPVLAVPQIDLSFPIDSILEAGEKEPAKNVKKLEKLSEENEKLDEKLKEMADRLAAAEQKSKELEARRRLPQN